MSLLMEALRKAEEAKRKAAQQGQSEAENAAPGVVEPEALSAVAQEALLDEAADITPAPEESEPQSTQSSQGLDEIAFDFHIDENFGLDSPAEAEDEAAQTSSEQAPADAMSLEFTPEPVAAPSSDTRVDTEEDREPEETIEWQLEAEPVSEPEPVIASNLSLEEVESSSDTSDTEEELDDGEAYLKAADLARLSAGEKRTVQETSSVRPVGSVPVEERSVEEKSVEEKPVDKDVSDDEAFDDSSVHEEAIIPPVSPSSEAAEVSGAAKPSRASATEESNKKEALIQKKLAESRKRDTVRAVFDAKRAARPNSNRRKLYAAAAVIALLPLAGGAYWLMDQMGMFAPASQYNIPVGGYDPDSSVWPETTEVAVSEPTDTVLPDVSEETFTPVPERIATDEDVLEVAIEVPAEAAPVVPEASVEQAQPVLAQSPAETAISNQAEAEAAVPADIDGEAESLPVAEQTPPAVEEESSPIRVVRADAPRVDPSLTLAYSAYHDNDFATARAQYQQALRNTPNSRDALLGLAAVAMKTGDVSAARTHYSRLLELDPRDALARVGLLESVPSSDAVVKEGELRSLFSEHPEVAQLAFALGNLLASQGRWNDAQQSYYDALLAAKAGGNGPVTPDYAFNLAVSLERLNQLRPAYDFYREALAQAQIVSPSFDVRVLRERLDALERVLP